MSKFNTTMGAVGAWVAAHPEVAPDRVELTVSSILRWLKKKGKPVTKASMDEAWSEIVSVVESMRPEEPEPEAIDPDVEKYRKQIESMTSDQLKEAMKDENTARAINNILNHPRPEKPQPKTTPKAKVTKPAKPVEEIAIEKMSADEFKRAISKSPQIARGIEATLAAAARRSQQ